jgi:hypothetical protein
MNFPKDARVLRQKCSIRNFCSPQNISLINNEEKQGLNDGGGDFLVLPKDILSLVSGHK